MSFLKNIPIIVTDKLIVTFKFFIMTNLEKNNVLELVQNSDLNLAEIAKLLKIDKNEIINFLIENEYFDLKNNNKARFPTVKKLHDAALYFINNNECYSNVCLQFGIKKTRFKIYMNTWYPHIQVERVKNYNENVFDQIDTEEKAYWLGFIYADGYISSDPLNGKSHYQFEITLSAKDREHLEKFAKFIGYPNGVKEKISTRSGVDTTYESVRILISSKHLWETLNNYGCTPKKSLTLKFPNKTIFKDESLIRHFIRGYFDGDGTLGIYENKCLLSVLGTENFLSEIAKFNIYAKTIKNAGTINHSNNAYKLSYSTKEAFGVAYNLYNNSNIYLTRKYDMFLEFCRSYKELYELLSSKNGENCDVNPVVTFEITKGSKVP